MFQMSFLEDRTCLEAVTEELENLDTTDSDDTAQDNETENSEETDDIDTSASDNKKNEEGSEIVEIPAPG